MQFQSLFFLSIFLPVSLLLYYLVPVKLKNTVLLAESVLFYASGQPAYTALLLSFIVISWLIGLLIRTLRDYGSRLVGVVFVFGAAVDLGLLAYFKYSAGVMPAGLSFITFQSISLLADVYRGTCEMPVNPLDTAVYLSMFPNLTAGPVQKFHDILPQIRMRSAVSLNEAEEAFWRIAVGLGKKVIIADLLGQRVDLIWDHLTKLGIDSGTAWLGIICYSLQIYFDFSGYSDIAIGLARLFGFHLGENFHFPYCARGMRMFWRRWHISLGAWFREYVYFPLGGGRGRRAYFNLLLVFLLTGIWHGSGVTFIIWGLWNAAFVMGERALEQIGILKKIPAALIHAVTVFAFCFGWLFFRAPSVPMLGKYMDALTGKTAGDLWLTAPYYADRRTVILIIAGILFCLPFWDRVSRILRDSGAGRILRVLLTALIMLSVLAELVNAGYHPFIYYQF